MSLRSFFVAAVILALFVAAHAHSSAASAVGDDTSSVINELDSVVNELDLEMDDGEDLGDLESVLRAGLTNDLKDKFKKATKKVKETGKKVVKKTKDTAKKTKEKTKDAAKTVKEKSKDGAEKVKDGTTKLGKKIKDGAEKVGEKIKETWELTEEVVQAGINRMKHWGNKMIEQIKEEFRDLLPENLKFIAELFTDPSGFLKKVTECSNPIVGRGSSGCFASYLLKQFYLNPVSSRAFLQMNEHLTLSSNARAASTLGQSAGVTGLWGWEDNANGYVAQDTIWQYHKTICNKEVHINPPRSDHINDVEAWGYTAYCNDASYAKLNTITSRNFDITQIKMNDNSCLDCQCKSNAQASEILVALNDVILSILVTYESFTDTASRGTQIVGVIVGMGLRTIAAGLKSECVRFGLAQ